MKKSTAILMVTILAAATLIPLVSGNEVIDKTTTPEKYKTSVPTTAEITSSGGGNPGGGGAGPGPDAPVTMFQWILPDDDDLTYCSQITPVPSGTRDVYGYTVIYDPEGRDDIQHAFFQVFFPIDIPPWCGMEKFKTEGVRLDPIIDQGEIMTVLEDVYNTGHITKQQQLDIQYWLLSQPYYYMFKGYLPMEYCEPAGTYSVDCWGIDTDFEIGTPLTTYFDFLPYTAMEIDFEAGLDFGKVEPDVVKYIQGDNDILTTPSAPTVKNEGNTKIEIQLKAENMLHVDYPQYRIDLFDVQFMGVTQVFAGTDEGEEIGVWTPLQEYLCLCSTKKIDFSIHPKENLPPGVYTGTMFIHIGPAPWTLPGQPVCGD